jgi:urease accessory protein
VTPAALLLALQQGDSAFPSGGFAFSWGLEGLCDEGMVATAADLGAFLDDMLANRWAGFDRIALRRAFLTAAPEAAAETDAAVEAALWSAPLREGSRRAGRALLGAQARLGNAAAATYRDLAGRDAALGHLPVAQGVSWRGAGLPLAAAEALGAWSALQAAATAALRLGAVGHAEAQAAMTAARPRAAAILAATPPPDAPLLAFTPVADIALTRHARRDARLFAT